MKTIRRLSLVIIASFVFAMGVFAAPAVQDQPTSPSASAAKAKATTPVTTVCDAADRCVSEVEKAVQLNGRSTYALSTCPATFTPIANTIDRLQPATPPPIY